MTHETIVLHGHIIDSLLLPKVLDHILQYGGSFEIAHIRIGKTREEPSDARIIVHAESPERLAEIIAAVQAHGASVEKEADCQWQEAPADGVFPDDFYVTTHLLTEVRVHGKWVPVKEIEMDLGIWLDRNDPAPHTVPMAEVRKGDQIAVGREGIRVTPLERPAHLDVFGFMGAQVSSERPHGHLITGIARRMQALRRSEARILLAGGPAIIHGGGREPLAWLIESGYIHVLFCGNALAAHDMEAHLYGTSLGLHLEGGSLAHHGHEHHLRTINRIRAIGSIEEAVRQGVITTGIMAACVRRGVKIVMAGTIPRWRVCSGMPWRQCWRRTAVQHSNGSCRSRACRTWFLPPTPGSWRVTRSSSVSFAILSGSPKKRRSSSGLSRMAMRSSGCRQVSSLRVEGIC